MCWVSLIGINIQSAHTLVTSKQGLLIIYFFTSIFHKSTSIISLLKSIFVKSEASYKKINVLLDRIAPNIRWKIFLINSQVKPPSLISFSGLEFKLFNENFCSFAFCNSRKTFNDLSLTRTTCLLLFAWTYHGSKGKIKGRKKEIIFAKVMAPQNFTNYVLLIVSLLKISYMSHGRSTLALHNLKGTNYCKGDEIVHQNSL